MKYFNFYIKPAYIKKLSNVDDQIDMLYEKSNQFYGRTTGVK